MRDISKVRFDALAAYARRPELALVATELRWFAFAEGQMLATLILDTDDQFSAVILAPDLKERFRFIDMTGFFSTQEEAIDDLQEKIEELLPHLEERRVQGDELGAPVDFFKPVHPPEELNRAFVELTTQEGFSPAMEIIGSMMRWYEDADGNFVEQFQTSGYDARIWELYLFAALSEAGYVLDRSMPAPDFAAHGIFGEFLVEATTVNPTLDSNGAPVPLPETDTPEDLRRYIREYVPIRYAGPLTAKLKKRYWTLPHVAGKPLVLAVHDFHAPMSMTWSRGGLPIYLYGFTHEPKRESDGSLTIVPERVTTHRWGTKEIPSGFFSLPEAENISAVIFNNSATISKFNRIGLIAGFGSGRVQLIREGLAIDHDPKASEGKPFRQMVDSSYQETWMQGMDVYHNPRARYPLDRVLLKGAAHHRLLEDGRVETVAPEWKPLTSVTHIIVGGHRTSVDSE